MGLKVNIFCVYIFKKVGIDCFVIFVYLVSVLKGRNSKVGINSKVSFREV